MGDVELGLMSYHFPTVGDTIDCRVYDKEENIFTRFGNIVVAMYGDKDKPAIYTYHDLGLNHSSNFDSFFNHYEMRTLMQNFCVYHLNAPGQEENALDLPDRFIYPSINELVDSLHDIMKYYRTKHFIGIGVGSGANILSRFALANPEAVDGLFLINSTCTGPSWLEWALQKRNSYQLRTSGMTSTVLDFLAQYHFGTIETLKQYDISQLYESFFKKSVNAKNLAKFITSYNQRTDLRLVRDMNKQQQKGRNFKCPVVLLSGAGSPHMDSTVNMFSLIDPLLSSWIKLSDCTMVLEEEPEKVIRAFVLFLQGMGYIPTYNAIKSEKELKRSLEILGKKLGEGECLVQIIDDTVAV